MKYRFTQDQMAYVCNFLMNLAHGDGVPREQRRNLLRLSNKWAPPRWNVDLKPADKIQVLQFLHLGLRMIANKLDEELKPEDKAHLERVSETILTVVDKLEGRNESQIEDGAVRVSDSGAAVQEGSAAPGQDGSTNKSTDSGVGEQLSSEGVGDRQ